MTPTRITYRHMDASPAIDDEVKSGVEKLASHFPDLHGCHVVIEQPHRRHQKGSHFRVLMELSVPGKTLVVSRDPSDDDKREDAHVVLHEAVAAAHRELQKWADDRRENRTRVPA